MQPNTLVGLLAIFTIGSVLIGAIVYFRGFLKDPRNMMHAKHVFGGGPSATTKAGDDAADGSLMSKPLKTRLDASIASQHPDEPSNAMSKQDRTNKVNFEKRMA